MNAEERRELWEHLRVLEDWLSASEASFRGTGEALGRPGPVPDFSREEAPPASPPGPAGSGIRDATDSFPGDSIEAIRDAVARCDACRLASTRKHTVPGQGVARPGVLVVGEGPGAEEDAQGLPFVGPAGRLLDRMLDAIAVSRSSNCYIANVVKCRPPLNREPAPDERASCRTFLDRQIAVLRPRAILCVGRTAAQTLLDSPEGIGRLRGRVHRYRGIPLVATYHPSALLRDETLKRPAWEDLKLLRTLLPDG